MRAELSSLGPALHPHPPPPHSARPRPARQGLCPVIMSAAGAVPDGDGGGKGGVLPCVQCRVECQPGEGSRWSTTLKSGNLAWYCRCADCHAFTTRMNKVLKNVVSKEQFRVLSAEQKKVFKEENKDKFTDDLAIALNTMYERVDAIKTHETHAIDSSYMLSGDSGVLEC